MERNNNLMSGKGEKGKWITVNGSHIFIEDGQSVEETMNKHFSKDNTVKTDIKQDKERQDKYTDGNSDNIMKSSTIYNISNDLKGYKGSGRVDLILSGGKWAQIRPQEDGSYLVRSNNRSKYVNSVEDAKQELIESFNPSKKEFHSKQELIDFIKKQTNIELKDDRTERFNDKENILYARIPGRTGYENKASNPVLSLLTKYGIRYEEHLNNGYWIWLNDN